jgi:hypothetical protein
MRIFFDVIKYVLVIVLIDISVLSLAQNTMTDSSATCISYWRKGEAKTFNIRHLKEKYVSGKLASRFSFSHIAHATVLDSTKTGFTVQWVFELAEAAKKANPLIGDSLPVYNGMKMVCRISEMGEFIELTNWEEVRDTYIRMTEIALPKDMDSTGKAIMEKTKALFATKQMTETALIREIRLYHLPYNSEFTKTPLRVKSTLPNPFGGDPMPAVQTYKITELNPQQDYFRLTIEQEIDQEGAEQILKGIFEKLMPKTDTTIDIKKTLDSFEITDTNEYKVIASTGWIKRIFFKRKVKNADIIQTDSYLIEMKD